MKDHETQALSLHFHFSFITLLKQDSNHRTTQSQPCLESGCGAAAVAVAPTPALPKGA